MTSSWQIGRQDAADILGVNRSTVYRMMVLGELDAVMVDGKWMYSLDDVLAMRDERQRIASLLTTPQVGRMLGMSAGFIHKAVTCGHITPEPERSCKSGHLFALDAVAAYWRDHMDGVCVRCSILGEARADLGFMCVACEHEARTGKLYKWPGCHRAPVVQSGRLVAMGLVE